MVDDTKVRDQCITAYEAHPTAASDAKIVELSSSTTSASAPAPHLALAMGSTSHATANASQMTLGSEHAPDYGWEATWAQQLLILMRRSGRHQAGVILSRLNLIQMFIMSIVAGLLWFQVGGSAKAVRGAATHPRDAVGCAGSPPRTLSEFLLANARRDRRAADAPHGGRSSGPLRSDLFLGRLLELSVHDHFGRLMYGPGRTGHPAAQTPRGLRTDRWRR